MVDPSAVAALMFCQLESGKAAQRPPCNSLSTLLLVQSQHMPLEPYALGVQSLVERR